MKVSAGQRGGFRVDKECAHQHKLVGEETRSTLSPFSSESEEEQVENCGGVQARWRSVCRRSLRWAAGRLYPPGLV